MRGGGGALHLTEEELEDSPESGAYSCGGIGKRGRTAASGVIRNGTEVLTAKAKGTSDSSFLWRIKSKEAGENAFSPASFARRDYFYDVAIRRKIRIFFV